MDLTKKVLPASVSVAGSYYNVRTDWRLWLRFVQIVQESKKNNTPLEAVDWLYEDKRPEDKAEGFKAMLDFAFPSKALPRSSGEKSVKVLDYTIDADLIYAAFREQYGIDLLTEDMHWHVFQALMEGLHGTKLNEVIGFRSYDPDDKTEYKEAQKKLYDAWTLAGLENTADEQKAEEDFNREFE